MTRIILHPQNARLYSAVCSLLRIIMLPPSMQPSFGREALAIVRTAPIIPGGLEGPTPPFSASPGSGFRLLELNTNWPPKLNHQSLHSGTVLLRYACGAKPQR